MLTWKDPTVFFTILIVLAPLLLHTVEHGVQQFVPAGVRYLLSPTMIASYVYLYLIVTVSKSGNPVKLSPRDRRAALWFLMNGKSVEDVVRT